MGKDIIFWFPERRDYGVLPSEWVKYENSHILGARKAESLTDYMALIYPNEQIDQVFDGGFENDD